MKKTVFFFVGLILITQPAFADDIAEVDAFMKKRLGNIMALLQDKTLQQDTRDEKIIAIITEAFDFRLMSKLTLGKRHWPGLSKAEKARFTELFIERLKASYLEKLNLYDDEQIVYGKPKLVKNKVQMMTELVSKDSKITMRYKLYKSKKTGWRVYDVSIEGVSLITTYRSQFNEVLQTGTMKDLFTKLERPEAN
ncbi:MAG: phospholipid-binding protein MlaC [Nitrospiria bacterium]